MWHLNHNNIKCTKSLILVQPSQWLDELIGMYAAVVMCCSLQDVDKASGLMLSLIVLMLLCIDNYTALLVKCGTSIIITLQHNNMKYTENYFLVQRWAV